MKEVGRYIVCPSISPFPLHTWGHVRFIWSFPIMPSFWVCLRIQFAQTLFLPCHLISDVPATFPFGRILTSPFQPWVTFFFIVTHPPSPTVPCDCWLGSSNLLSYAIGLMSSWNSSVAEVHICVCACCMFWICTLIFWYLQRDSGPFLNWLAPIRPLCIVASTPSGG